MFPRVEDYALMAEQRRWMRDAHCDALTRHVDSQLPCENRLASSRQLRRVTKDDQLLLSQHSRKPHDFRDVNVRIYAAFVAAFTIVRDKRRRRGAYRGKDTSENLPLPFLPVLRGIVKEGNRRRGRVVIGLSSERKKKKKKKEEKKEKLKRILNNIFNFAISSRPSGSFRSSVVFVRVPLSTGECIVRNVKMLSTSAFYFYYTDVFFKISFGTIVEII